MSFILDALKKSEAERQRQSLPGLVDAGVARPPARLPVWVIAVVLLLVVNLVVLALLYWHHTASEPTAASVRPAVAHEPAAATPTAGTTATHFSPMDSAPPVYAPEIPADASATAANDVAPGTPHRAGGMHSNSLADTTPTPRDSSRDVRQRDPVLTDDYKPEDQEVLPTMNEMNLSGAQALPELHLDVHVFATKPSERFVYINMRKYHEKGTLQEGPTVEKIRRDGVVLEYHGVRFLLPRQ